MQTNNLHLFFDQIKQLGFFQRIFYWRKIKKTAFDAYSEYNQLINYNDKLKNECSELKDKTGYLENEHEKMKIYFEETEKQRRDTYNKNITELNTLKSSLENRINEIQDRELQKQKEKFEHLKTTWQVHEKNIEQIIKNLCNIHLIEYVENVPFRGKPDNTIFISGEFIIFDAKSPANDNLDNFQNYLKIQVESLKKYANAENVKKDIFLVIPSNTLDVIQKFNYTVSDYNVYIISPDAIEPILLMLKKIEDYDFAEQLSPEERENISRIIGRFVHTSKRRIQIDMYFAQHIYQLLSKVDFELPQEIKQLVKDFERAEKINPPRDDRSKEIDIKSLLKQDNNLI